MILDGFDCPFCGEHLDVRLDEGVASCPSCGETFKIGSGENPDLSSKENDSPFEDGDPKTLGRGIRDGSRRFLLIGLAAIALVLVILITGLWKNGSRNSQSKPEPEAENTIDARSGTEASSGKKIRPLDAIADGVDDDAVAEGVDKEDSSGDGQLSYESVPTTWELGEGFYTAGVDIPAGRFDVIPTGGIGFISTQNDAADLRGPGHDDYDDYASSYKNFKIANGEELEVRGVQIRIEYTRILSDAPGRVYDESKCFELSAGNYIVGQDIGAGRYNIEYVSGGGGFVASDREDGESILVSDIDGDPDSDTYVDTVSNAILVEGEEITVTSGLTLRFIPEQE